MRKQKRYLLIIFTLLALLSTGLIGSTQQNQNISVNTAQNPHIGFPCNYDSSCDGDLICDPVQNICR